MATDMVPNTPRRGMRGWAVRSLCITQIKSYHPNEPLRRKVPEMNTFPQLGGGHLGDPLFLQRRARVKDKYCQLRQTHTALPADRSK